MQLREHRLRLLGRGLGEMAVTTHRGGGFRVAQARQEDRGHSFGITASMSISTSISGKARPLTINPVPTGAILPKWRPTT